MLPTGRNAVRGRGAIWHGERVFSMFCGNNNGCLWIIIILILLCGCGGGCGCNNGCGGGCNNGCGC